MAEVEGKAGAVNEATFFEMPKWNGIWVVQPNESLFNWTNLIMIYQSGG